MLSINFAYILSIFSATFFNVALDIPFESLITESSQNLFNL